jgi:hypothetical protein
MNRFLMGIDDERASATTDQADIEGFLGHKMNRFDCYAAFRFCPSGSPGGPSQRSWIEGIHPRSMADPFKYFRVELQERMLNWHRRTL